MKKMKKVIALIVAGAFLAGSAFSLTAGDVEATLPAGALLSSLRVANTPVPTNEQAPVGGNMWEYRTNFQVGNEAPEFQLYTDRPLALRSDAAGPHPQFGNLNFVITHAPEFLIGQHWIQVNNNQRTTARPDQMVLTAAQPIYVYVGIDHRSAVWQGTAAGVEANPSVVDGPKEAAFQWLNDWERMSFEYFVTNNEGHNNDAGRTDLVNPAPMVGADVFPPSTFYLWRFKLDAGASVSIPAIGVSGNGNIPVWLVPAGAAQPGETTTTEAPAATPAPPAATPAPPTVPTAPGDEAKQGEVGTTPVTPVTPIPPAGDNMTIVIAVGSAVLLIAAIVIVAKKRQSA